MMRSETEHSRPFVPGEGDPEPSGTAVWGLVGALLILLSILLVQAMFYRVRDEEYVRKTYGVPWQPLVDLKATQLRALSDYRWVDRATGAVTIPIDRAMELVTQEARSDTSSWTRASRGGAASSGRTAEIDSHGETSTRGGHDPHGAH